MTSALSTGWTTAIDGWCTHMILRGLSPNTIELRRQHISYLARHSGVAAPHGFDGPGCYALFIANPHWSSSHRRTMRDSVLAFFDHHRPGHDFADHLMPVRVSPPRPRPATDDIWTALLAAAAPRERLIARLAGEAGLRRAEVVLVHSDDVIPDRDGQHCLIVHGKGGKQRVVALTESLAAELAALPRGFAFPGRTDGHISARHCGELISELMPDGWSMHKLRHRYATRGYAGTGNLRAVQEALGHASVATTQRYTAVSTADVRAVSEAASHPSNRHSDTPERN
jgi:integrase